MKASIKHYKAEDEYFFVEGCHINELHNSGNDPDCSIARARVSPGVTTAWHQLTNTVERYVIIEGKGRAEIEGLAPTTVGPGDVVNIPANAQQRICNTGKEDLIFLAICTPRFDEKNYVPETSHKTPINRASYNSQTKEK